MKSLWLISVLMLALIVSPVCAYEWHSGTWSVTYPPGKGNDTGYPPSNLASGGTWKLTSPWSGSGGPCYDAVNTSRVLKYVSFGIVNNTGGSSSATFQIRRNTPDAMTTYLSIDMPAGVDHPIETNLTSSGYRYYCFHTYNAGGTTFMQLSNPRLFWDEDPIMEANFTGNPLSHDAPATIALTDTSTLVSGTAATYNWSGSGPGPMYWYPTTKDTEDISLYLPTAGNYTITHGVSDSYGSDIETKTDYIWVYNGSSTATTCAIASDLTTGHELQNVTINMRDVENSSWTNTTLPTGGAAYITTLSSHTLDILASSYGYEDEDSNFLGVPTYDGGCYNLVLKPIGYANVTPGNVTLWVSVRDKDTTKGISGASVTATIYSPSGTVITTHTTNAQGSTSFIVTNNTNIALSASASGYVAKSAITGSGTGSGGDASVTETIYLSKTTLTTTPTPTTIPGTNVTPTVAPTVLPGCEDPTSQECQDSQNNYLWAFISANALALIELAFVVTILYMVGWKP